MKRKCGHIIVVLSACALMAESPSKDTRLLLQRKWLFKSKSKQATLRGYSQVLPVRNQRFDTNPWIHQYSSK